MKLERTHYDDITAGTARLLADGFAIVRPADNPEVFDVSLVAGHAGLCRASALAFDDLTPFVEQPLRELRAFEMLETVPPAQAHLTIFPLFQNKPRRLGSPGTLQLRAEQYDKLTRTLQGIGPMTGLFEGLCLAPTGAVILKGFCEAMSDVRHRLSEALPDTQRTLSPISHVTLARLRRPATRIEFQELFDWCTRWQAHGPTSFQIVHPKLVATGDQNGMIVLEAEMTYLLEWNRRIRELAGLV